MDIKITVSCFLKLSYKTFVCFDDNRDADRADFRSLPSDNGHIQRDSHHRYDTYRCADRIFRKLYAVVFRFEKSELYLEQYQRNYQEQQAHYETDADFHGFFVCVSDTCHYFRRFRKRLRRGRGSRHLFRFGSRASDGVLVACLQKADGTTGILFQRDRRLKCVNLLWTLATSG